MVPLLAESHSGRSFAIARSHSAATSIPSVPPSVLTPRHFSISRSQSDSASLPLAAARSVDVSRPPRARTGPRPARTLGAPTSDFEPAPKAVQVGILVNQDGVGGEMEIDEEVGVVKRVNTAMPHSSQDLYWEMCRHRDGLIRLDEHTFIIQDWDERSASLKVRSNISVFVLLYSYRSQSAKYLHIRFLWTGFKETSFTCDCGHVAPCVHISLLVAHYSDVMIAEAPALLHPLAYLVATMFSKERFIFSVSSTSTAVPGGGKRTLVFLLHNATWRCQSCGLSGQCHHVGYARSYALNAEIIHESGEFIDPELCLHVVDPIIVSPVPSVVRHPVSHRPVPVPRWCRVPSDTLEYDPIPNPDVPPGLIELDDTARCSCGKFMPAHSNDTDISVQKFTVFGLRKATDILIQVVRCAHCKHWRRNYGSDCGALGIFNWNNVYGFTHELLNQYTNVFTSAENPLSSFVTTVRRVYEASYSPVDFCSTETFTKVWFSFTNLQALDSGMDCSVCGKFPEIVVADGVSIGYSSSKYKRGLRPPSMVDGSSPINASATLIGAKGAALISSTLRKELRSIMDMENVPSRDSTVSVSSALCETIPGIDKLLPLYLFAKTELRRKSLRALFNLVNIFCYVMMSSCSPHIKIAADDIILQLVPYPSIALLAHFANSADRTPPPHLKLWIPSFGNVFAAFGVDVPSGLQLLADWLSRRAYEVYSDLEKNNVQFEPASLSNPLESNWHTTGVCYGTPPIRVRPHYSQIPGDGLGEDKLEKEESECGKYYNTYKKVRLTGGIMVLWCRHSVCVGFHVIPTTEGRNDVFSALYAHWPVAPKIVVYDYACQLAPYAMVREPAFFRDTRFVVDEFHAMGHTKCSSASSATHAMQYDPNLQVVNTSAAEVGNSGVGKIRKSVSYMTQTHAIEYTKVYMDVMNRCKRRHMS